MAKWNVVINGPTKGQQVYHVNADSRQAAMKEAARVCYEVTGQPTTQQRIVSVVPEALARVRAERLLVKWNKASEKAIFQNIHGTSPAGREADALAAEIALLGYDIFAGELRER